MIKYLLITATLVITHTAMAQNKQIKDWHLLDYETDGYRGISLQKAYDLLKGKKGEKVIVAVIDSGIDTAHNDISFWKNQNEIPNNGKDDNNNGLVDDYYGWNYLGAANGENLSISINDYWRTYHRFKSVYNNADTTGFTIEQKHVYNEWLRAKTHLQQKSTEAGKNLERLKAHLQDVKKINDAVAILIKKDEYTVIDLNNSNSSVTAILRMQQVLENYPKLSNKEFIKQFEQYVTEQDDAVKHWNEAPIDERAKLLNDDSYDISKIHYGNHNLKTHSGNHGTSVSSIIGAYRNNKIGIDGIADNVEIMMIRGILGKDEYDKDVALAIRYAVDNGAKVINMSFGKYISPEKRWVDDAIQYAHDHDVVVVHAAGNDAENIDLNFNYPNAFAINEKRFSNFINVGASGDTHNGGIVAFFTNYGNKMVDIFAPGVDINCATTGGGVQFASGTSMASPVVAGVAAMLRSYFPKLTATQVVDIILKSGVTINEQVQLPSNKEEVKFKYLSKTGAIVNAYKAVQMCIGIQK